METLENELEAFLNERTIPRTREGLIKLFVKIIKDKPYYQFDPKRMIFDVLPLKAKYYQVYTPNFEYSLGQSRDEHGNLAITEHRFINFLMFTDLAQQEIDMVFDAYENATPTADNPNLAPPSQWQYTIKELYQFLRAATPDDFSLPLDAADGVPVMTEESFQRLQNDEVERKEKLKKELGLE